MSSDPKYFKRVYVHTFDFGRSEGQRSMGMLFTYASRYKYAPDLTLALESAKAFWQLLLPLGLQGGALSHTIPSDSDEDGEDVPMADANEEGWKEEYNEWWFDFLDAKNLKGVSKDTWTMVRVFSIGYETLTLYSVVLGLPTNY